MTSQRSICCRSKKPNEPIQDAYLFHVNVKNNSAYKKLTLNNFGIKAKFISSSDLVSDDKEEYLRRICLKFFKTIRHHSLRRQVN